MGVISSCLRADSTLQHLFVATTVVIPLSTSDFDVRSLLTAPGLASEPRRRLPITSSLARCVTVDRASAKRYLLRERVLDLAVAAMRRLASQYAAQYP